MLCKNCGDYESAIGLGWCWPCINNTIAGERKITKNSRLNIKERVFSYYSGGAPCCAYCGISDLRVLELHHTNYDGKSHRENHGGTLSYTDIECEGYPDGLRSLCANCHRVEHSTK